jgi:hypothetical protein
VAQHVLPPAALVTNLLELAAASIPDPNAEEALFALHTIVRTNGKSDELGQEGPEYKFPLQTLGGLVTPRGLSDLADLIRCGAISNASEMLGDLVRCDYKKGIISSFCRAIAESPLIDAILDIIGYDDVTTRAYLELKPNQGKYVRTHTGFTGEFRTKPDPRPLALDLLSTVMEFHGFGDGERLRPAIAPIVRVLRLTCQEGAQPCPDTFETRLHAMNILARLCGTKYRLSRDVLRQGGLDAAICVLERLKLPGSTATPRLLRKGIWDATLPLFALAAADHLASVQAALAASPEVLRVSDVITGEEDANNAARLKLLLTTLSTCSAEGAEEVGSEVSVSAGLQRRREPGADARVVADASRPERCAAEEAGGETLWQFSCKRRHQSSTHDRVVAVNFRPKGLRVTENCVGEAVNAKL